MERETVMKPAPAYDVAIAGRFHDAIYEAFSELKSRVVTEAARLASQRRPGDGSPTWITQHDLVSAMKTVMPAAEDCLVRKLSDEAPSYVRTAS